MLFGIFTHVEANEFNTEFLCQYFRNLCLTYAGRTNKEHACHRFAVVGKSRLRHLHRLYKFLNCLVLTVNLRLDAVFKRCE